MIPSSALPSPGGDRTRTTGPPVPPSTAAVPGPARSWPPSPNRERAMAFDPALLALFAELRGGSLITLKRDGRPQASVVIHAWYSTAAPSGSR